eukprot:766586-Hanusia_phi.AAC.1
MRSRLPPGISPSPSSFLCRPLPPLPSCPPPRFPRPPLPLLFLPLLLLLLFLPLFLPLLLLPLSSLLTVSLGSHSKAELFYILRRSAIDFSCTLITNVEQVRPAPPP